MSIIAGVKDVVSAPFVDDLDLKHLFLLTGIVMVFTAMWAFILAHMKTAALEVID